MHIGCSLRAAIAVAALLVSATAVAQGVGDSVTHNYGNLAVGNANLNAINAARDGQQRDGVPDKGFLMRASADGKLYPCRFKAGAKLSCLRGESFAVSSKNVAADAIVIDEPELRARGPLALRERLAPPAAPKVPR
jgi:hypothetical protein